MKTQKLSEQELQEIETIQKRMKAIQNELGLIGISEIDLQTRKTSVHKFLSETRDAEGSLAKELEEKYGKGSIDLQEGIFIPSPTDSTANIDSEVKE